jgi:hypothetical protein
VHRLFFLSEVCASNFFLQVVLFFFLRCSFSERSYCFLLKATRPEQITANVPVNPDVSPSSKGFILFPPLSYGVPKPLEWTVLPHIQPLLHVRPLFPSTMSSPPFFITRWKF